MILQLTLELRALEDETEGRTSEEGEDIAELLSLDMDETKLLSLTLGDD